MNTDSTGSPEPLLAEVLALRAAGWSDRRIYGRLIGVHKVDDDLARSMLPNLSAPPPTPTWLVPSAPAHLREAPRLVSSSPAAPKRAAEEDGISYQYVPLIQCSFPHADPREQTSFTRRNGWLELTLGTARADLGLPYGVPSRLITMHLTTEAVRTKSREISIGDSVHEYLRLLEVPIARGPKGSIAMYSQQVLRLVHCTFTIQENIRDGAGRQGLDIRNALFVEAARLWWDSETVAGAGSSIVLSQALFDSILERSAPLSTSAIKTLRRSPMDLDVYAWAAHRLHHLTKPSLVTWEQLSGQFGHNYSELRRFRKVFAESLRRVLEVYPAARIEPRGRGVWLQPSAPHVAKRVSRKI